jgi:tetratricopeptide (TPR) repeat protein
MNSAWLKLSLFAVVLALPAPATADEAAVHYNQGLVLKRQGRTEDAIAEMKQAVAARKDYAAAWFSLGNLYRGQGDYNNAVASLSKGDLAAAQGCRFPRQSGRALHPHEACR